MNQAPPRNPDKKHRFSVAAVFVWAALGLSAGPASRPVWALTDGILAVVNEDVITMNDLRRFVQARINQLRAQGISAETIRDQIDDLEINGLQRLIEEKLLAQAAREMGMQIRPEAIEKRLDQIIRAYDSSEDFIQSLSRLGLSLSEFKAMLEEQMLMQAAIEEHISRMITVSPSEVAAYYQEHIDEFQSPETLRLDGIFIPSGNEPQRDARARAEEALKRLREGEAFEKVKADLKASNPLGEVKRGQLKPDVERRIFALKEGEVSDVIETDQGYYIVKLLKRLPARRRSLADAHDEIEQRLFRKKFQTHLEEWLAELKRKSHVEIRRMAVSQSASRP